MARISSFAAVAALFTASTLGMPVTEAQVNVPNLKTLIGFDPTTINLQAPKVFAERIEVDIRDIWAQSNVTSTAPSAGLQRRLIGSDNRYQYTNQRDQPWRNVGRILLDDGKGTYCTGALVGPRHVLTARHCIPPSGTGLTFYPGYDQTTGPGGRSGLYKVTYPVGFDPSNGCDAAYDFAIVILQDRLGDNLGWFGTSTTGDKNYNQAFFETLGYPSDRSDHGQRPFRQDNSKLPNPVPGGYIQESCNGEGPIYSDTDAAPGQSGSPLWVDKGNGPLIYGVLHGGNDQATSWAAGLTMTNFVNDARKNFP